MQLIFHNLYGHLTAEYWVQFRLALSEGSYGTNTLLCSEKKIGRRMHTSYSRRWPQCEVGACFKEIKSPHKYVVLFYKCSFQRKATPILFDRNMSREGLRHFSCFDLDSQWPCFYHLFLPCHSTFVYNLLCMAASSRPCVNQSVDLSHIDCHWRMSREPVYYPFSKITRFHPRWLLAPLLTSLGLQEWELPL